MPQLRAGNKQFSIAAIPHSEIQDLVKVDIKGNLPIHSMVGAISKIDFFFE